MANKLSSRTRRAASVPASIGDNSMAGDEGERVQLISIVAKLSTAEEAIEAAKLPLKAAQADRKRIIGLGKAAGFTAKELEKRLDEMKMGTREMAEQAARENKHRRWLGIIEPDQAALILGDQAPQETKDEAHWRGEGLKAGLRNLPAKAPSGCPERFVQPFLQERERGVELAKAADGQAWPDAVDGRKKSTVSEQAAADFAADNPDVDLDAEAKRLAKDPAFMARGTPPEQVDDGFEATENELAQQSTRQVVREVRQYAEGEAPAEEPSADVV